MGVWPPAPAGFKAWSGSARDRVASLLAAILPPEELGGTRASLPEFVGGFAATLPVERRVLVRIGLEILWLVAPLFLIGKPVTFSRLEVDEQERLLRRLVYSRLYPLRLLGLMLKSLAGLATLGDPAVRRHLVIDPSTGPLPPVGDHVRWDEDIEGLGR